MRWDSVWMNVTRLCWESGSDWLLRDGDQRGWTGLLDADDDERDHWRPRSRKRLQTGVHPG